MADVQIVEDAAALRAAATERGLTGSRLSNACAQIIAEEKVEADRIASDRMKIALEAQAKKPTNVYEDIRNGIIR